MPLTNPRAGHPTAAGEPDRQGRPRMGIKGLNKDGVPGVPKSFPAEGGHGHGSPSQTTSGPIQPGAGIPEEE